MSEKKNRSFFHDDSYEKFRYFLKLNFYYCTLSKEQQAENINPIGPTKYSYYKDIIEMIASGKIAFPKYNKKKAFKYDVSQFESDYNVLANSFQLRTTTPLETCLTIHILSILVDNPMTIEKIKEKIINSNEADGEKSSATIENKVKKMHKYGLISFENKKYYVDKNIFYSMDEDLLLKLLNMADFMKNLVYPEVSGYNLFDIMKKVYEDRICEDYYSPFQFKYSHLLNILDDGVLWMLIEAIEKKQYISFNYDGKKRERIIPVKLFTENEYSRRYLFAVKPFRNSFKIFIFRLSKIYDLKVMKKEKSISDEEFKKYRDIYESEKGYSFSGKLDSSAGREVIRLKYKGRLKKQIMRDFSCVKFEKGNIAEVVVTNKKMVIPYLRANMGLIETTDEELSQKINSEIEEMKKIYGII